MNDHTTPEIMGNNPCAGDVVCRELDGGLPGCHFGVRVGVCDGIVHVVHLTLPIGSSPVRCTEQEFGTGKQVRLASRNYLKLIGGMPANRSLVAERALGAIGSKEWRYSILKDDCDAFVRWCVTGEKRLGVQSEIYRAGWRLLSGMLEIRNAWHGR